MSKILTIFFTLNSVPDEHGQTRRRYNKEQMTKEFPADTIPEVARESILQEYGYRPAQKTPLSIIAHAHQFAEIDSWRVHEKIEPEPIKTEAYEQAQLL